jgi:hypothetical protein
LTAKLGLQCDGLGEPAAPICEVPLMLKVDREVQWGTDDPRAKGGDYFGLASGQK